MRFLRDKNSASFALFQIFCVFAWLMKLTETDSIYSVYVLCGLLGAFCIWDEYGQPSELTVAQNITVSFLSLCFSMAVILANYKLIEDFYASFFRLNFLTLLVGGFFLARSVLCYFLRKAPVSVNPADRKRGVLCFFLVFLSVTAIELFYLFTAAYPGVLTQDSIGSIREIVNDSYSNVLPYCYTMSIKLFYRIGMDLFGDINSAVACFTVVQVLFMAGCIAYLIMTLYQLGIPIIYCVGVYASFVLLPHNIVYPVTMWKDVSFAAGMLLMGTSLYRIIHNIGKYPAVEYVIFVMGSLGMSLSRTNGWYAYLAVALIFLVFFRKNNKKILAVMGGVLAVGWLIINLLMPVLHVSETDLVEAFSIPLQQLARVVSDGGYLAPEELELLEAAFDMDIMREDYNPYLSDPIKWFAFCRDNRQYVEDHFFEYVKMWLRIGRRYPGEYLKAWIEQTKGYWNGGYEYWIYATEITENDFGIFQPLAGGAMTEKFEKYCYHMEYNGILDPLYSIGFHVWLLVICFAANVLKKRKEALLAVPALVIIVSLWIGTPVYSEFRYAYPMFLMMPLILGTTLFSPISDVSD